MSRAKKNARRQNARRQEAAAKLLALGIFFVLLPWFFGESRIGTAFQPLAKWGWLVALAGGVLLWLYRTPKPRSLRSIPAMRIASARPPGEFPPDRVASTIDELLGDRTALNGPRDTYYRHSARTADHPTSWSRAVFDVIEWRRFEAVVETLFKQAGFATQTQSHGADRGVDVWLYVPTQPDQPIGLVQCKHWQKNVGVDKVRELRGVMAAHRINRGHFATTSVFTQDAKTFAQENNINLFDIDTLLALITKRSAEQQAALLEIALEGEYWRPTCANCGIKMVERERKADGQPFWGCSNFPRCNARIGMRANAR